MQRLRLTDSWEAPLSPCPSLNSRSVAEAWGKISPYPFVASSSRWEWHSWLAPGLVYSGTSLMSSESPSSKDSHSLAY